MAERIDERELKAGDVLLSLGVGRTSEAIKALDGGQYSHAALWTGTDIIESTTPKVIQHALAVSLQKHPRQYVDVYRRASLTEAQAAAVVGAAKEYADRPYAFGHLALGALVITVAAALPSEKAKLKLLLKACEIHQFLKLDRNEPRQLVTCTELVVRSYQSAGTPLLVSPTATGKLNLSAIWGGAMELAAGAKRSAQEEEAFRSAADAEWAEIEALVRGEYAELVSNPAEADGDPVLRRILRGPGAAAPIEEQVQAVVRARYLRLYRGGASALTLGGPPLLTAGEAWSSSLVTPYYLEKSPDLGLRGRLHEAAPIVVAMSKPEPDPPPSDRLVSPPSERRPRAPRTDYLRFDLQIDGYDEGTGRARILAQSDMGEAEDWLVLPPELRGGDARFKLLEVENALLRAAQKLRRATNPDAATLKTFGAQLFTALFPAKIRTKYAECQGRALAGASGLRLRLIIRAPELAALPWELMYDRDAREYVALSRRFPLVRYVPSGQPVTPLEVRGPLRILGVSASPRGMAALDHATEEKRLGQSLRHLGSRVSVKWLRKATPEALHAALSGEDAWHVLHFSGHGMYDEGAGQGVIALQREDGEPATLSAEELGPLIKDHPSLKLLFLNACEGAKTGRRDLHSSLAGRLSEYVPAVVAMQYPLSDDAAVKLASALYASVATGFPIDAAVAEARKALRLGSSSHEWVTPILFMRSPEGVLFELPHGVRLPWGKVALGALAVGGAAAIAVAVAGRPGAAITPSSPSSPTVSGPTAPLLPTVVSAPTAVPTAPVSDAAMDPAKGEAGSATPDAPLAPAPTASAPVTKKVLPDAGGRKRVPTVKIIPCSWEPDCLDGRRVMTDDTPSQ